MQKIADGVWQAEPGLVHWTKDDVEFLEGEAVKTEKLRARILAHRPDDRVHEMLIAFAKGSDNPMHSHFGTESVFVLSGTLLMRFEDRREVPLLRGEFMRIPPGVRHRPVPLSDCVIVETVEK